MKELIKFCMLKHEADIRKLAETSLGGQRFELLIRRYEMNNEPPPKETEPEKYVVFLYVYEPINLLLTLSFLLLIQVHRHPSPTGPKPHLRS